MPSKTFAFKHSFQTKRIEIQKNSEAIKRFSVGTENAIV